MHTVLAPPVAPLRSVAPDPSPNPGMISLAMLAFGYVAFCRFVLSTVRFAVERLRELVLNWFDLPYVVFGYRIYNRLIEKTITLLTKRTHFVSNFDFFLAHLSPSSVMSIITTSILGSAVV